MEVSQNRDTPTCLFYNGKSENDMDDLGVALWLRKPPYLRNPQPGILDGPSSVWIYARVQKFWPRKKTRLRWFYSNPQLCSTKQQNIFYRRGFIQQNKSSKHPLSIDVSNIKPLAIMTLKRQTGSMDSLLWKSQTTKLKSIYLHYKAHATPHRVYSQIVTEPGSSMKTTLTSQPDQDRKKTVFRFLFARLVFFRLISFFFARVVHMKKCASGNFGLSL